MSGSFLPECFRVALIGGIVTELPMFVPVVCIMSAPRHATTVVNTFLIINYNTSPIILLLGPQPSDVMILYKGNISPTCAK